MYCLAGVTLSYPRGDEGWIPPNYMLFANATIWTAAFKYPVTLIYICTLSNDEIFKILNISSLPQEPMVYYVGIKIVHLFCLLQGLFLSRVQIMLINVTDDIHFHLAEEGSI